MKRTPTRIALFLGLLFVVLAALWWSQRPADRAGSRATPPGEPPAGIETAARPPAPLPRPEPAPPPPTTEPVRAPGQAESTTPPRPEPPVREPEATLPGGLRLLVVDESETAVGGARVVVTRFGPGGREESREQTTDRSGLVELADLVPGKHYVSVRVRKVHQLRGIEVASGRTAVVKVVLPRGGALLEGVIRDVEGSPLAGVGVRLRGGSAVLGTKSDGEGRYRIEDIPPGSYRILAENRLSELFEKRCGELVVKSTETIRRDLVIGFPSLCGVVRDAQTREPLAGVMVRSQKPAGRASTTDADGAYRLHDLPAGRGKLVVVLKGYELLFVDAGEIEEGQAKSLDIELKRAAVLNLQVTDESGLPVVGGLRLCWVDRDDRTGTGVSTGVTADADGHAVFRKLPPGRYGLYVRRDEAQSPVQELEIRPGINHLSFQIPMTTEPGAVALSGSVVDATTGQPIRGVAIRVKTHPRRTAYTDAAGRYVLRGLETGTYQVHVAKDGWGFHSASKVKVVAGRERVLDVSLVPAATLILRLLDSRGRVVSGRASIAFDPLGDAGGTDLGTRVEPDEEGRLVFRQIVPGAYRLRINAFEHGSGETRAEIVAGENVVEVQLE